MRNLSTAKQFKFVLSSDSGSENSLDLIGLVTGSPTERAAFSY